MFVVRNMVYLDYSATTPVNKEVLDTFIKVSTDFIGNPNSLHKLGVETKKLIDKATEQIASILGVKPSEIIYTSGASESNNAALKGIAMKYKNRGNHIITTPLEHSSIYGPLNYLAENGFEVDFVKLDEFGRVDLEDLQKLMKDTTILVSISAVNSEIGIQQPLEEISKIVKSYPKCFFHVDMTQAVGKIPVSLDDVDLASFSAHKFYGMKGIGVLVKKEAVSLEPLIHGGKSTTPFRSGTPAAPLIVSTAKALRLAHESLLSNLEKAKEMNAELCNFFKNYESVSVNSNAYSIPHILNISILGVKPETMLHDLEEEDIYISTQSACATGASSKAVLAVTNDEAKANSSIRISLSGLTTKEEIEKLKKAFDKCYHHLIMK